MSVNEAVILGHLGGAPDVTTFQDGGKVANFSVATSKKITAQDGTEQEYTEWHRIVVRNGLAGVAERFLKKGAQVYVKGELRTRSYKDKAGATMYVTEIHANKLEMLGAAPSNQNNNQGQQFSQDPNQGQYQDQYQGHPNGG